MGRRVLRRGPRRGRGGRLPGGRRVGAAALSARGDDRVVAALALALVPVDGARRRRRGRRRDRRLPHDPVRRRVGEVRTVMTRLAALTLLAAVAPLAACSERETHLKITFDVPDAGACDLQTNIKCVNYLEFTAGDDVSGFSSSCTRVDVSLDTLCDVAKLAEGQELFK